MFSLKQLNIFIALARMQKVVDVASKFNITQAAISMSIKELENILSERLFERIGKRLILNERGSLLLEQVTSHVEVLQEVFDNFTTQKLEGHLRICASATISDYLLPTFIDEYFNFSKNVKFLLKSANTKDVIKYIKSGEFDIGFIEGNYDDESLISKVLMKDELIVVSSDKQLSQKGAKFIDSISDKQWILREVGSGMRSIFLDTISPSKVNIHMELDHTQTIKKFLKLRKNYISCLPKRAVEKELQEGILFEIKIKGYVFQREFKLIIREDRKVSALINNFTNFITSRQA